jgi:hypothetical protein
MMNNQPSAGDATEWLNYAQQVLSGKIRIEPPVVAKLEARSAELLWQSLTGTETDAEYERLESKTALDAWDELTEDEQAEHQRWHCPGGRSLML